MKGVEMKPYPTVKIDLSPLEAWKRIRRIKNKTARSVVAKILWYDCYSYMPATVVDDMVCRSAFIRSFYKSVKDTNILASDVLHDDTIRKIVVSELKRIGYTGDIVWRTTPHHAANEMRLNNHGWHKVGITKHEVTRRHT